MKEHYEKEKSIRINLKSFPLSSHVAGYSITSLRHQIIYIYIYIERERERERERKKERKKRFCVSKKFLNSVQ